MIDIITVATAWVLWSKQIQTKEGEPSSPVKWVKQSSHASREVCDQELNRMQKSLLKSQSCELSNPDLHEITCSNLSAEFTVSDQLACFPDSIDPSATK